MKKTEKKAYCVKELVVHFEPRISQRIYNAKHVEDQNCSFYKLAQL